MYMYMSVYEYEYLNVKKRSVYVARSNNLH